MRFSFLRRCPNMRPKKGALALRRLGPAMLLATCLVCLSFEQALSAPAGKADKPAYGSASPADQSKSRARTTVERHQLSQKIPFPTVTKNDPHLPKGKTKTLVEGKEGSIQQDFAVVFSGNDFVCAKHLSTKYQKPVTKVVAVGTALPPGSISRGGVELRYSRALEVVATGYCPCAKCCGKWASGFTATGLPVKRGVAAVDPSVIPLGSRLWVEGYGMAIAGDKGSAIKGLRIDLAFDTHEEALAFGRRRTTVYVLTQ